MPIPCHPARTLLLKERRQYQYHQHYGQPLPLIVLIQIFHLPVLYTYLGMLVDVEKENALLSYRKWLGNIYILNTTAVFFIVDMKLAISDDAPRTLTIYSLTSCQRSSVLGLFRRIAGLPKEAVIEIFHEIEVRFLYLHSHSAMKYHFHTCKIPNQPRERKRGIE